MTLAKAISELKPTLYFFLSLCDVVVLSLVPSGAGKYGSSRVLHNYYDQQLTRSTGTLYLLKPKVFHLVSVHVGFQFYFY